MLTIIFEPFILSFINNMIKYKNVVGKKPTFYLLEGEETMDIDTPLDFKFAEFLYTNR